VKKTVNNMPETETEKLEDWGGLKVPPGEAEKILKDFAEMVKKQIAQMESDDLPVREKILIAKTVKLLIGALSIPGLIRLGSILKETAEKADQLLKKYKEPDEAKTSQG
jgi:hypothetical protein